MTGRCLALWFPGWSITAWELRGEGDGDHLVAMVSGNRVVACSAAAVIEGVRPGQRRREAQSRCPQLRILAVDPARDAHEFAAVVDCVERLSPGVQVVRSGLIVLRAQGLASYLGDEGQAAETLLEAVITEVGVGSGRVGVADTVFAAVQASRGTTAAEPVRVVGVGKAKDFLAGLPIERLGDPQLTELLPRLGIRTLGEFAALDGAAVRARFGLPGCRLHDLAAGRDRRQVIGRKPPPELAVEIDFEPALTVAEQVAFSARATIEKFVAGLTAAGLVCTEARVEFHTENDECCSRLWGTPTVFDVSGLVDRLRWQLHAAAGSQITGAVCGLRIVPVSVDDLAHHASGLFGLGPDERVHHVMSRVQSMLGFDAVVTAQTGGGRWLAERQVMVPWSDQPGLESVAGQPWPGSLPTPLPASVFPIPLRAQLVGASGRPVGVDRRGQLTEVPQRLRAEGAERVVIDWAGPWPVDERFWDPVRHRVASRFQVVDGSGTGWLLFVSETGWWVEGRYD